MKEELAWVCAIMPDDINRKIVSLCKELNAGILCGYDVVGIHYVLTGAGNRDDTCRGLLAGHI